MPYESDSLSEGRERWKTEEQFINNRLTWLGFTQSILFAIYSTALNAENQTSKTINLINLIPFLGLLTSIFIFIGVIGATIAMYHLKKIYSFDDFFVSFISTIMGWSCNIGIPAIFVLCWLILLSTK